MSNKVIGFVGLESYDIIHYAGRMLARCGCSVLLVDASNDLALAYTMPEKVLREGEVLEYSDVDMARLKELDSSMTDAYDYVLVYTGWNLNSPTIPACEEVFCFTDYQMQNIARMNRLELTSEQCRFLVIRNCVTTRFLDATIEELSRLNFTEDNVFTLPCSPMDEMCKLQVQYDGQFKFKGVSQEVVKLLVFLAESDADAKNIKKVIKKIQKG